MITHKKIQKYLNLWDDLCINLENKLSSIFTNIHLLVLFNIYLNLSRYFYFIIIKNFIIQNSIHIMTPYLLIFDNRNVLDINICIYDSSVCVFVDSKC